MTEILEKWRWGDLLSNSFQDEDQNGFIEVSPDAGQPFRRETFTDIDNIIKGYIIVSLEDYLDFKSWYRNTIKQGTIPFTFYDCRIEVDRTARFLDKPLYRQVSNYYQIEVKLSLEQTKIYVDYSLLTEGGEYLLTEGGENLVATKELIV
ncbi:MAG: hypothetical protein BV457_00185 [Thermoplasmata archaeon M9B1D]|nr:MAG: hypothetical protein BV457_00185 [Thermoplasmata archaeon M9B1D]PNX52217.1 MAG: hypothetical protein BV456_00110 [Thermoplasmata archaeon M8B2D]